MESSRRFWSTNLAPNPFQQILSNYVENNGKYINSFWKAKYLFLSGRQHRALMEFCQCEDEAISIIRHRMWPSSPKKPQAAYSFHFMEMMRSLMLESHVSIKSYLEAYTNMHMIQNDSEVCLLLLIFHCIMWEYSYGPFIYAFPFKMVPRLVCYSWFSTL